MAIFFCIFLHQTKHYQGLLTLLFKLQFSRKKYVKTLKRVRVIRHRIKGLGKAMM